MKYAFFVLLNIVLLALSNSSYAATPIDLPYGGVEVTEGAKSVGALPEPEGKWWSDAIFYQIFPRSFADGNGDGIGDFQGILSRLDALNSIAGTPALGVNAIWLTPVFDSPSYHGYDTRDYLKIHSDLGTLAQFRDFLDGCKRRGIRVVLDLMLNHTASEHPWFIEAMRDPNSSKRNWYVWREHDPGWTRPWSKSSPVWFPIGKYFYYSLFSRDMPDLNWENAEVLREFVTVAKFWLGLGVSGFRLDAVKHLVEKDGELANRSETHAVLKRFVAEIRKDYPDALFVGEIWDGPDRVAPYFGKGDELDLAFGFNSSHGILRAVRDRTSAPFVKALRDDAAYLPAQRMNAPFLTNHDMDRVAKILDGKPAALKLAATTLLSLPGTPFLYNGEEIGVTNSAAAGDEGKRATMLWTSDCASGAGFGTKNVRWTKMPPCGVQAGGVVGVKEQQGNPASLWNHYRKLIETRLSHRSMRQGILTGLSEGKNGLVILERAVQGEIAVVAINFGNQSSAVETISFSPRTLAVAGFVPDKFPAPNQIYPRSASCFMAAAQKLDCVWNGRSLSLNPVAPGEAVWVKLAEQK